MADLDQRLERARREGAIAVRCPGCGGEAGFHVPFLFLRDAEADAARADPGVMGVPESGGFLVELFPEVFLASDPARGGAMGRRDGSFGVLVCAACGRRERHRLRWPTNAYFRVELDGAEVWAFTREQAVDDLALLETLDRLPRLLRPLLREEMEMRFPPEVLDTGPRQTVIARLRALLGEAAS